jgi:hypothetical protein
MNFVKSAAASEKHTARVNICESKIFIALFHIAKLKVPGKSI